MTSIEPECGFWYRPASVADWFRVLRVDDRGQVTIEFFDGYEDVIDAHAWGDLAPQIVTILPGFLGED